LSTLKVAAAATFAGLNNFSGGRGGVLGLGGVTTARAVYIEDEESGGLGAWLARLEVNGLLPIAVTILSDYHCLPG